MPGNSSLSTAQINKILCWIDNGSQNNQVRGSMKKGYLHSWKQPFYFYTLYINTAAHFYALAIDPLGIFTAKKSNHAANIICSTHTA
jgi:hypothetical protein